MPESALSQAASNLARRLEETRTGIVFAESCTCGLVAATLGEIPGISRWLCGSAVVYQEATKTAWIEVPERVIATFGVVSAETAVAMAAGVLARTPHAELAVSVTGHLGPNAPPELDGVVYAAAAFRGPLAEPVWERWTLSSDLPGEGTVRSRRRTEAATRVVRLSLSMLGSSVSGRLEEAG